MYLIIMSMFLGLIAGYFSRLKINKLINKAYVIVVSFLLFLIGVSTGSNKEIFSSIGSIGMKSIILAFLGISGSIAVTFALKKANILIIKK